MLYIGLIFYMGPSTPWTHHKLNSFTLLQLQRILKQNIERERERDQGNGVTRGKSDYVRARNNLTTLLMDEFTEFVDGNKGLRPQCEIGRGVFLAWTAG